LPRSSEAWQWEPGVREALPTRLHKPRGLYGLLELRVALFALISHMLLDASQNLSFFLHRHLDLFRRPASFLLAVLLLAVPAIFMGGTWPLAAAALRS